ncbi:MAG: hypothetical protein VR65_09105 [Desulfobulbaceae bacterium BRH_c16a]|nr:MAG: hypothetical protein VR65_09105 [Desulfobulbaceae bacterium BRH_c16a]
MKKFTKRSAIAACLLTLLLSSPAVSVQKVEDLKGKQIQNEQGEQLGTIEKVLIGPDGNIQTVVIEKGGFLGLGGETNRIPWNALKEGEGGNFIYTSGAEQEQSQASMQQKESGDAQQQQSQAPIKQDKQGAQQEVGQATAKQDQQGAQSGQVSVQQPGAQVQVDQSQPHVQVEQAEPKVSVAQPEPQVTVKQPPPKVTVHVEQPKPEVTVQQQKPKVSVQQEDPKVSVQQQKPEVTVQQQKPKVTVTESKPDVQVSKSGQPQVIVEEQKQAQVNVQRQGEPQVNVVTGQLEGQQQGRQAAQIDAAKAEDLMGHKVVGRNGEQLGIVKKTHLSQDGNTVDYLIVQGSENKMHPVPAELVQVDEAKREITTQIDQQTFDSSPSFSEIEQPQLGQQQWSQEIESHYGISPAWQEGQDKPSQRMEMEQQPGSQQQMDPKKQKTQQ